MKFNALDNPVWHALLETHQTYALDYNGIQFYHPDYCPFGGFTQIETTQHGIDQYAQLCDDFFIVGERPHFGNDLQLQQELVCKQMTLDHVIEMDIYEEIVCLESEQEQKDLFKLVNLVQPGYFKNKTPHLGHYYGIYKANQLVAATGERMKMNGLTEVSAVVTHPEYRGKGYAKQLIVHTCKNIFSENKKAFLHVTKDNIGAIKLYEQLGFKHRRDISFWHLIKNKEV